MEGWRVEGVGYQRVWGWEGVSFLLVGVGKGGEGRTVGGWRGGSEENICWFLLLGGRMWEREREMMCLLAVLDCRAGWGWARKNEGVDGGWLLR